MSTKQREPRQEDQSGREERRRAEQEAQECGLLEAVVAENVMHDLGEPAGLHRVHARQLWGHYYRVNVFVGADAASSLVAHSYFVAADGNGKVLTSTPAITRLY
jgi:hypothetical protein